MRVGTCLALGIGPGLFVGVLCSLMTGGAIVEFLVAGAVVGQSMSFLFIIGDVSGKGASAALYMARAIGMFFVAAGFVQSPRAVLALLNRKSSASMA